MIDDGWIEPRIVNLTAGGLGRSTEWATRRQGVDLMKKYQARNSPVHGGALADDAQDFDSSDQNSSSG